MNIADLFALCKERRLKTSFALYSPAEDDLPAEVKKWYVDYADIAHPISVVWRPNGNTFVEESTAEEYQIDWGEYIRLCKEAWGNPVAWEKEKADALRHQMSAKDNAERRFWLAAVNALEFMQVDSRIAVS